MATLQLSANFWTLRDDVIVPDCDLGAFKYHNKDADTLSGPYASMKKSICQTRGKATTPSNRRPTKLRDMLVEFEEILAHHVLVHVDWSAGSDQGLGLFAFSNGFLVHMISDLQTCDIVEIVIDRTLEGKLLADVVSVTTSSQILVLAHGVPHLTVIQVAQPLFGAHLPTGIPLLGQCSVTVSDIRLPGPGTSRQERRIIISPSNNTICAWWERDGGELFAWAPIVKAEDRANILIYSASPTSDPAELLACHYTEHNPFSVQFSTRDASQLRVTELVSTPKGRLSVSSSLFRVQQPFKLVQQRTLRIPALLRCHSHSPDELILLLGCVDMSIIVWDLMMDTTLTYKASFIPFHLTWHSSSSFFVAAGERCQLQCWDRAGSPLLLRSPSATVSATAREQAGSAGAFMLHLQQYLRHQPSVVSLKWPRAQHLSLHQTAQEPTAAGRSGRAVPIFNASRHQRQKSMRSNRKKSRSLGLALRSGGAGRPENNDGGTRSASVHLLVCFERGPVVCLQFLTSCWPTLTGPYPTETAAGASINSLSLCSEFLAWGQLEFAVRHLLSLKWMNATTYQEEDVLLSCFMRVVNSLLTCPSPTADDLLQRVITTVLDRLSSDKDENGQLTDPVLDAARRSCRVMMRKGRLHSAAAYALRLQDADLLVELVLYARKAGDESLVAQATTILDCIRDDLSSASSGGRASLSSSGSRTRSSSQASSYISGSCASSGCSGSSDSSGSSCSTCDDDEDEDQPAGPAVPVQVNNNISVPSLSGLRLAEDNEDHVHVISFGVV